MVPPRVDGADLRLDLRVSVRGHHDGHVRPQLLQPGQEVRQVVAGALGVAGAALDVDVHAVAAWVAVRPRRHLGRHRLCRLAGGQPRPGVHGGRIALPAST